MIEIAWNPSRGAFLLSTVQIIRRPLAEVFDFFADAFRLEEITPPWLNFHVITPAPIAMSLGTLIDYRLRLHGIPIRWRTEIEEWKPPFSFVDRQLRGPYSLWRHEHRFSEAPEGTRVVDEVAYRVPGGVCVNRLFVAGDLRRIFAYRRERLSQLLEPSSLFTP